MDDLISQMAEFIIEQNRYAVGNDVADDAINRIRNEKGNNSTAEKGGMKENVQEKTKRRRTSKTA